MNYVMLQNWDSELSKKHVTPDGFSRARQSDAVTDRVVRSSPPRGGGGGRGRPVSDGQSYRRGGGGSNRLRPAEPRAATATYTPGNRQRLSSSEELSAEVRELAFILWCRKD